MCGTERNRKCQNGTTSRRHAMHIMHIATQLLPFAVCHRSAFSWTAKPSNIAMHTPTLQSPLMEMCVGVCRWPSYQRWPHQFIHHRVALSHGTKGSKLHTSIVVYTCGTKFECAHQPPAPTSISSVRIMRFTSWKRSIFEFESTIIHIIMHELIECVCLCDGVLHDRLTVALFASNAITQRMIYLNRNGQKDRHGWSMNWNCILGMPK